MTISDRAASNDIRNEQAKEGARMAALDSDAGREYHRPSPRRSFTVAPKTKAPKGHEAFLKALEVSGTNVAFEKKSSGDEVIGVVKHSDKYTVTVRTYPDGPAGRYVDRVLFKHDISEFSALQARPTVEPADIDAPALDKHLAAT